MTTTITLNEDTLDISRSAQTTNDEDLAQLPMITSNYGVLNWEQVRKLDNLLNKTVPIHGRGNYPTLNVKLKDFIRNLNKRLIENRVRLRDIRINGGAASYVLAKDNTYEFSDIDIIFTCDMLQTDNYNSDETQQGLYQAMCLDSCFANCCDVIKETVFDCLIDYIPASDCSASKEKLTWLNIKDAYVKKMVKIYEPANANTSSQVDESYESLQSLSRWSLISFFNNQGQNIELKFVDKMRRQFQFSVDAFQIHLDSLLKYYDCQDSIKLSSNCQVDARMTENVFPSVKAESMYGDFREAITHLDLKLIATKQPEEIRGGGLLKYCNLLIRGYTPECDTARMNSLEKYMCSRFFIDFSDIKEQEFKLSSYLDSHFQNDSKMCILYLNKLYHVVNASTVCLMGHERKQTLNLIELLAKQFNNNFNLNFSNLNLTDTSLYSSINNYINNSNNSEKVDFYLEDLTNENPDFAQMNNINNVNSKTFSSSSSEVDLNDSQAYFYNNNKFYKKLSNFVSTKKTRQFNNNNNNNNHHQFQNQNQNSYNNQQRSHFNNFNQQQINNRFYQYQQQQLNNLNRNNNRGNNNGKNFAYPENQQNYYNYYYYGYYQNQNLNNQTKEHQDRPDSLKPVDSSSSSSSLTISSTSTSPSPSPSPSLLNKITISSSSASSISCSNSTSSSNSSSSSSSSIVPSPSPSPPLLEQHDNDEEDLTKRQEDADTVSRVYYCKLPVSSSNSDSYIEVFENYFSPPVFPVLYDQAFNIDSNQQFYSNVMTHVLPSGYN